MSEAAWQVLSESTALRSELDATRKEIGHLKEFVGRRIGELATLKITDPDQFKRWDHKQSALQEVERWMIASAVFSEELMTDQTEMRAKENAK